MKNKVAQIIHRILHHREPIDYVLSFNRMLMELKREYDRIRCPLANVCPFVNDNGICYGQYTQCPVFVECYGRSPICIARFINEYER